ncbi:hypothetical protein GJAV_G00204900 [Gymnothorax javanicus]|nr:hypothetical protein GJAV_G00204900 [Gymnothorax javanicus]
MITPAFIYVHFALWSRAYSDSTTLPKSPEQRDTPSAHPGCVQVNPEELSCAKLNLTSVPTRLDPRLKRLDLSYNWIKNMSLLDLRSLQELDASGNGLRFLQEGTFQGMFRLRTLILAGNALNKNAATNSKAFPSLLGLRSLDMSSNGLDQHAVAYYLDQLYSLNHLKLANNALTKLTSSMFSRSHRLTSLNMENNLILDIEEGTFESLKRLAWLNLAHNNLACICDFTLHGLKVLNLSRNSIEFFITNQSNESFLLEMLDLSHNSLLYFPILPKINHLRHIHLQNNKLGILLPEKSILEANSLYKEIHYAALGSNETYSIRSLELLTHLDLSMNELTSFPSETFSYLPSLEALNISSNCLHDFGLKFFQRKHGQLGTPHSEVFPALRSLDLQHNQISSLELAEALPRIETLNLRSNLVNPCAGNQSQLSQLKDSKGAACVSFSGIRTLKHLNLGENGIDSLLPLTFQHTPLASLDLSRNPAMTMVGGALRGLEGTLEMLIASGNEMEGSDLSLQCLGALKKLDLAWNRLQVLPDSVGCSPLQELDLRHNRFTLLDGRLLTRLASHLAAVFISGNAFNCCTGDWLEILNRARAKATNAEAQGSLEVREIAYAT